MRGQSEKGLDRSGWARRVSWLVLVGGIAISLVVASAWRSTVDERNQQAFSATASSVKDVVSTQVARHHDLLATLRGLVTSDQEISNTFFLDWYNGAQIHERFQGSIGLSYVVRVPAVDLPAFALRQQADPVTGLSDSGPFTVFPEGPRAEYCLQRLGVFETDVIESFVVPAGLDFCVDELPGQGVSLAPAALEQATDTGLPVVLPIAVAGGDVLGEFGPVYADGGVPDTVGERRAKVIGWVGASFDARTIVDPIAMGEPNLRVEVFAETPSGRSLLAAGGKVGPGPVSTVTLPASTDGDWTVRVSQVAGVGGFSTTAQGLWLFAGGLLTSVLLFALVRLLIGSRDRAVHLVREKTGELEFLAMHDELTGLPNRALLLDRATQLLARRSRTESTAAALFIDLDNFKAVNDTLGHAAGDDYLRAVATRIAAVLRDSDTVGRLGGDEFVVLVDDPALVGGADLVAQRIVDVLSEPIVIDGVATPVSCSIGIAYGTDDSAESLLHHADLAMYEAKAAGKGRYTVFVPEMQDAAADRINLEWELRGALERDELFLLYQPTFDLHTGVTTGVEALIRWDHPRHGVVQPTDFIPIAEETNLIIPIGRWVLNTACTQGAAWAAEGHPIRVAVNVSARQLERGTLIGEVRHALEASGLDPGDLTLEITESTLMRDTDETLQRLEGLKALGVNLAIDDFGTGYSSMAYLQRFPVDTIKIDRSFITDIAQRDDAGRALIRTLVQLGKTLNLEILAEGIEDDSQLDALIRDDCDTGQGFLYAEPLSVDALTQFLTQHTVAATPGPRGPPDQSENAGHALTSGRI